MVKSRFCRNPRRSFHGIAFLVFCCLHGSSASLGRALLQTAQANASSALVTLVTDGQELVDALRLHMPSGQDVTLLLKPTSGNIINCTGVPVPDYTNDGRYTAGVLTIRAADGPVNGPIIVDLGYKSTVSVRACMHAKRCWHGDLGLHGVRHLLNTVPLLLQQWSWAVAVCSRMQHVPLDKRSGCKCNVRMPNLACHQP